MSVMYKWLWSHSFCPEKCIGRCSRENYTCECNHLISFLFFTAVLIMLVFLALQNMLSSVKTEIPKRVNQVGLSLTHSSLLTTESRLLLR